MSSSLSCCHGVGYNDTLHVCADVAEGCDVGTVCPIEQIDMAFCGRCDFDRSTRRCGIHLEHVIVSDNMLGADVTADPDNRTCFSDAVVLYSGLQLQHMGALFGN